MTFKAICLKILATDPSLLLLLPILLNGAAVMADTRRYIIESQGKTFSVTVFREVSAPVPEEDEPILKGAQELYKREYQARGTLADKKILSKMAPDERKATLQLIQERMNKAAQNMLNEQSTLIVVGEDKDPANVQGIMKITHSTETKSIPIVDKVEHAKLKFKELKHLQKKGALVELAHLVVPRSAPDEIQGILSEFGARDLNFWSATKDISAQKASVIIQPASPFHVALYQKRLEFEPLKSFAVDPNSPWQSLSFMSKPLDKFISKLESIKLKNARIRRVDLGNYIRSKNRSKSNSNPRPGLSGQFSFLDEKPACTLFYSTMRRAWGQRH